MTTRRPGARATRIAVQTGGFVVGLGLLAWCISLALTPENREQLRHLGEAPLWQVALLLLLSFLTLNINGALFWLTLRPVRRLHLVDVLAVNGVATFLIYLPFKLSALVRVLIHNRRDRVPLLTIGAWFAAVAVLMFIALAPAVLAALWRQQIDSTWLIATLAGQLVIGGAAVFTARLFRGSEGQVRLAALIAPLRARVLSRLLSSRAWTNLHAGFDMIACPRVAAASIALRLADIAVHAGRFALAAAVINLALPLDQALLIALAYFLIGVVSPFGVLGTRETGAMGMAVVLGATQEAASAAALVALLVSASEAIVFLLGAALGLARLGPTRLLRRPAGEETPPREAREDQPVLSGRE